MTDVLRSHLDRARAAGLVAPIPPASLHYIVLGAAGLVFSQAPECRYITGVDPTEPDFADRHADALIELLIGRHRHTRPRPARRTHSASRRRR